MRGVVGVTDWECCGRRSMHGWMDGWEEKLSDGRRNRIEMKTAGMSLTPR